MSETKSPASEQNVDLVIANTVSRLGCTVSQARKILAEQSAAANTLTPAQPAQPTSKSDQADGGEALL